MRKKFLNYLNDSEWKEIQDFIVSAQRTKQDQLKQTKFLPTYLEKIVNKKVL